MKVLVVANDGQIRDAVVTLFEARNREYLAVGREWLSHAGSDIGGCSEQPVISSDVGLVVNAISLESLSLDDESLINELALLAQVCEQSAIPLLQLSSSLVFDGLESARHTEQCDVSPCSDHAVLLARMEELVETRCNQHIILRSGPIFSGNLSVKNNVLVDILQAFTLGGARSFSNVGSSCPVHADDLARVISGVIDQIECGCDAWGVYHYCSSDPVSHYHFVETVLAVVAQHVDLGDKSLSLVESSEADANDQDGWSAPLLNCQKIFHTFGIKQLPWRVAIIPTVKSAYNVEG